MGTTGARRLSVEGEELVCRKSGEAGARAGGEIGTILSFGNEGGVAG